MTPLAAINVETWGAVVGPLVTVLAAMLRSLLKRLDANRAASAMQLAGIATHLNAQDAKIAGVSERLARLEGPVKQAIADGGSSS